MTLPEKVPELALPTGLKLLTFVEDELVPHLNALGGAVNGVIDHVRSAPGPAPTPYALTFPNSAGSPLRVGDVVDVRITPKPPSRVTWTLTPNTGGAYLHMHRRGDTAIADYVALEVVTPGRYDVEASIGGVRLARTEIEVRSATPTPDPVPLPVLGVGDVEIPEGFRVVNVRPFNSKSRDAVTDRAGAEGWHPYEAVSTPRIAIADGVCTDFFEVGRWEDIKDVDGDPITYGPGFQWLDLEQFGTLPLATHTEGVFELSPNFRFNPSMQQKLWMSRFDSTQSKGSRLLLNIVDSMDGSFRLWAFGLWDQIYYPNDNMAFKVGRRYKVRTTHRLSRPGRSDGSIRVLVTDEESGVTRLVHNHTGINWQTVSGVFEIKKDMLWGGRGGHITEQMWIKLHGPFVTAISDERL